MPQVITGQQAKNVGKPRPIFIHGKLLPVEAEFYKWADKDTNKNKIPGTGGKVSYAEWVGLPDGKKGQKWFLGIDQKIFHPEWERPTVRGVMVDFPEWQQYILPGLLDAMSGAENPIQDFLDRANENTWYAEAELVHSGFYEGKPQNLPRFTRFTQDEATLRTWYQERYPQGDDAVVPEDKLASAKFIWARMAKGDKDIFNTQINEDPELAPYLVQFAANDHALVKG